MPLPSFRRFAPALSLLLVAAPLAAQSDAVGAAVNAASETGEARSPVLFGSAGVAPRGTLGLSLHATAEQFRRDVATSTGPSRYRSDQLVATPTLHWGATSWLTIGGYAQALRGDVSFSDSLPQAEPDPSLGPTRRRSGPDDGLQVVGIFGRARLWESTSRGTRVGTSLTLVEEVDRPLTTEVGLALQHRAERITLHVAPAMQVADGFDPGAALSGAAVLALGARLAASLEGTHRSFGASRALDDRTRTAVSHAGAGLRWRAGRLAIDGGVRMLVGTQNLGGDIQQSSFLLATRWTF